MKWIAVGIAVSVFALGLFVAVVLRSSGTLYMDQDLSAAPPTTVHTTDESAVETTTETDAAPPHPAPAPAPVAPPSVDEAFAEIDRVLAALPVASAAFNAPAELGKDEATEIQLLLSLRKTVRTLQATLTEIGQRQGARVRVSPLMEARLTGSGFAIEAITPERQPVSPGADTQWKWHVEATETGSQRLFLTLSALIDVEGERTPRAIRTFERAVVIHVSWEQQIAGFLGDNWQWLWAAILAPAAGVTWGTWRRRSA